LAIDDGRLTIELPRPIRQSSVVNRQLLRLFVRRVLPTESAELAELDPFGRLLLVLRRAVVAAFTLPAREMDDVSHK
jgi:hypothetical protein